MFFVRGEIVYPGEGSLPAVPGKGLKVHSTYTFAGKPADETLLKLLVKPWATDWMTLELLFYNTWSNIQWKKFDSWNFQWI